MDKLKIIIPTCDKYLHCIEALVYTIDKYWEDHGEVIILGYKKPNYVLPTNTTFHSMGDDRGPKYWSDDLIKYFNHFEDEYFIYFTDDTPIIRSVNSNRIKELYSHMLKDKIINKIFISGTLTENSKEYNIDGLNLVEINQNSDYRTSVQTAIIKTTYIKKYLKPNQSPWDFELQNSKNDGLKILSVKMDETAPIIWTHMYRDKTGLTDNWDTSMKTGLKMYDKDKIIIKKILNIK